MKKIIIFLIGTVGALAILPLIGNEYVKSHIEEKVATLDSYGLGVEKHTNDSSYLSSKQHYEFLLEDGDKFLEYLSQYSDKQIPKYVNAALEGVLIGMDVEYSNIPFTKAVSIDIYPLALSPKMAENIKQDDITFYTYLEKFLESKGILYHINYNILSKDFDGYIKDVKETYTLKDKTELLLELKKAIYKGNGDLIAPNSLISNIDYIHMKVKNDQAEILFTLNDLSSSYTFDSQFTYLSGGKVKNLDITIDTDDEDIALKAKDIQVNVSSNDQGEKAELNAKASMESLDFKSNKLIFKTKSFAYDIAANEIDKKTFEKLQTLMAKSNTQSSDALSKEIADTSIDLLSKGLKLKIAQWNLEDIILNETQALGGFDVKMDLEIKEDPALASKLQVSPMLVAQNIDMVLNVKISKLIYANLTANQPMAGTMAPYMKEDGDSLLFDITFKKGELKLNGKALR